MIDERAVDAAVAMFERQHALDLFSMREVPAALDRMMLEEVQREHARLRKWWTVEKETRFHGTRPVSHRVFVCRICGRRRETDYPMVLASEHAWFHLREIIRRKLEGA
jgi:hypothetical protein